MFTFDDLHSRHFLVTWTLSCEKNNASRPDGEVFSFSMYDKFSISR